VGRPGTGKSTFMAALVQALQYRGHTWILTQMDPTVIGGLPYKTTVEMFGQMREVVKRAPHISFVATALDTENTYVHGFDEFSNATPAQRSAFLDLVTRRYAGDLPLPESTRFWAGMNPANCAVVYHPLQCPTATRWVWIDWEPAYNRESWRRGMLEGWPEPKVPRLSENWQDLIPMSRAMLVGFEKRDPTVFHEGFVLTEDGLHCPEPAKLVDCPTSNGRTLEMAAVAYAATLGLAGSGLAEADIEAVRSLLIKGILGEATGRALVEYFDVANEIPSPEEILADPTGYDVQGLRPDLQFLMISSVGAYVRGLVVNKRDSSADAWARALRFVQHVDSQGAGDLAMVCASLFIAKAVGIPTGAKAPKGTLAVLLPVLNELKSIAAK